MGLSMVLIQVEIDDKYVIVNNDNPTLHNFSPFYYEVTRKDELNEEGKIIYGKGIFEIVFCTDYRKELLRRGLATKENVHITISSDSKDIHNIPFELINIDGTFQGFLLKYKNFHLSRSITSVHKEYELAKYPINILVLLSQPLIIYKTNPINPLKELDILNNALRKYIDNGLIEIDIEVNVTKNKIKEQLKRKKYDIIHFSGHGTSGGNLIFEDGHNTDQAESLNAEEIEEIFNGVGIKLFFFNACESARSEGLKPSLAYQIYKAIPNCIVIANLNTVEDLIAIETTKYFYKSLFDKKEIGSSLHEFRRLEYNEWWRPVIFGKPDLVFAEEIELIEQQNTKRIIVRNTKIVDNFVYRYEIIRIISDYLERSNHVILYGMAGTGKSTLANYISIFFDMKYDHHIIINLKDESIENTSDLLNIISKKLKVTEFIDHSKLLIDTEESNLNQINAVLAKSKLLLVLDNIENTIQDDSGLIYNTWKEMLRILFASDNIYTILTTRIKPDFASDDFSGNMLRVDEYNDPEFDLLLQNLGSQKREFIIKYQNDILRTGGRHPLFLKQVIANEFINTTEIDLSLFKEIMDFYFPYFEIYKQEIKLLFFFDLPLDYNYINDIFTKDFVILLNKLGITFIDILQMYPLIRNYFYSDYILDKNEIKKLADEIVASFVDKHEYKIDVLNSIHTLIKAYLILNEKAYEKVILNLCLGIDFHCSPVYTHFIIENLSKIVSRFTLSEEDSIGILNVIGNGYLHNGEYNKAKIYYDQALIISENYFGKNELETAIIYNNQGLAEYDSGNYNAALELRLKVLSIYESKLGKKHRYTLKAYANLGGIYSEMGLYNKALEYYYIALKSEKDEILENENDSPVLMNNIGTVYMALGDYNKALEYFTEAYKLLKNHHFKESEFISSYNLIGRAYGHKGHYDDAIKCYLKAIRLGKLYLGNDHINIATGYNNLAITYEQKGYYAEALSNCYTALEIEETKLGENHCSTATTYNNLAIIYQDKGDYDKAIFYYEKCLNIRKNVLDPDHPDISLTLGNMAGTFQLKGEYDKAKEYYLNVIARTEINPGIHHPDTATTYNDIAMLYYELKEFDKAIEYSFKALRIREESFGERHYEISNSFNNIGLIYTEIEDYNKALEYLNKGLEIRKRIFGISHDSTATSYNNIGLAYLRMRKYEEAIDALLLSLEILEAKLGFNHNNTIKTAISLVESFDSLIKTKPTTVNYSKAIVFYKNRVELSMRLRDPYFFTNVSVRLIDLYIKSKRYFDREFYMHLHQLLNLFQKSLRDGKVFHKIVIEQFKILKTFNTKVEGMIRTNISPRFIQEFNMLITSLNK